MPRACVSLTRLARSCWGRARPCTPSHAESSFPAMTLIAVLTALSAFDLAFTQSQLTRGNFAEANSLAVALAQFDPLGIATYKLVLFSAGVTLLYRLRHHRASQAGLWLLTGCYAALMVWWVTYLNTIEICLSDSAVVEQCVPY